MYFVCVCVVRMKCMLLCETVRSSEHYLIDGDRKWYVNAHALQRTINIIRSMRNVIDRRVGGEAVPSTMRITSTHCVRFVNRNHVALKAAWPVKLSA